jgi:Fe-S cluster assembly protein SufD
METKDSTQIFSSLYNENRGLLVPEGSDFYGKLRDDAIHYFIEHGFPAKKDEKYKYTFLEPLFNNGYNKNLAPKPITFDISEIFKCDVPSLDTHIIILVNGFYYNHANPMVTLPNGIVFGSFQAASKKYPKLFEQYLGKQTSVNDSYLALNTAFSSDGFFLYAPKNATLEKPLQVINVLLSGEELMVQPRNLFILEEGSDVKVVVCDHTLNEQKYLTNSVTEIEVGENAQFDYFKVQNEHNLSTQVSHTFIHQQANSHVQTMVITLHGGLVRNNLDIKLDGPGAACNAYGLFFSDKNQHVDNYVFINHAKPNCTSSQLYKGVLDNESTGAFTGKILVDRDAQKTLAYQKNSNLLLTNEAKMNTKPQLEIYADDVKCSHGATVGQLDEEALFYLRSRGIPERESRLMLMYAFAHEVLHEIKIEPLKIRMNELIDRRLRGELSRCNNCAMNCREI